MQGGRNPNRIQKKLLSENGYDSNMWLYIKTKDGKLIFKSKDEKQTDGIRIIELDA